MPGLQIEEEISDLFKERDETLEVLRRLTNQGIPHQRSMPEVIRLQEVTFKYNQINARITMLESWKDRKKYPEDSA